MKLVKKILAVQVLLLFAISVKAQDLKANEQVFERWAEDALHEQNYADAFEIYAILDSLRPNNAGYSYGLGVCGYHAFDKPGSLKYFLKALTLGYSDPMLQYYLGRAYQFHYDYENATYHLQKYIESLDSLSEDSIRISSTRHLLAEIDNAQKLLSEKLSVKIGNLGATVNSELPDYVPLVIDSGKTLIFTSRRKGNSSKKAEDGLYFEDIYESHKDSTGQWSASRPHEAFNSKSHDAVVSINRKGDKLFLYRSGRLDGGDIYVSEKKDNKWLPPRRVKGINSPYWEGSVALTADDRKIYFSSDRPGGYGGSDLYEGTLAEDGSTWISIKNLGPVINTPFDEDAPYIHTDGKTLFFSSKGHFSGGGYDIFSTKLVNGQWEEVKNLGFPINTADDDIYFHLTPDGAIGYFSSHRPGNYSVRSIGEKDLFELERPHQSPYYFVLKGKVFNDLNHEPVTALVTLTDMKTGAQQEVITDINSGKFKLDIKFENEYQLVVYIKDKEYYSKKLYFPYEADLFESLLEIPILNSSIRQVELSELSFYSTVRDTVPGGSRIENKEPTILLSRKYHKNDKDLQTLLTSKTIPVSFRKRLMKQLQQDSLVDESLEEEVFEGNELGSVFEEEEFLEKYDKLDNISMDRMERASVRAMARDVDTRNADLLLMNEKWSKLSGDEQQLINRFTAYLLSDNSQETQQLKTMDRLKYENLEFSKKSLVNKLILHNLMQDKEKLKSNLPVDSTFIASLNGSERSLYQKLVESSSDSSLFFVRQVLKSKQGNAWNKLTTFETSGFESFQRLKATGRVMVKKNGLPATAEDLLLVDDHANVLQMVKTDSAGYFSFSNLLPGERYHILIDDYLMSIAGVPKFRLEDFVVEAMNEDFYNFYDHLSEEEQRAMDRIIAYQNLMDKYQDEPDALWEDKANYDKLDNTNKESLEHLSRYFAARTATEQDFALDQEDAIFYQQLPLNEREEYNTYITQHAQLYDSTRYAFRLHPDDSLLYASLSLTQKGYLHQLKLERRKQAILFDNMKLKQSMTASWVAIGQIDVRGRQPGWLDVTGRLLYANDSAKTSHVKLALLDSAGRISTIFSTGENGAFKVTSIPADQWFKVLIALSDAEKEVNKYTIVVDEIIGGEQDFYSALDGRDKEMVDRVITTLMAGDVQVEHQLVDEEKAYFDRLTAEEKQFFDQMRHDLFAESLVAANASPEEGMLPANYNELNGIEKKQLNRALVNKFYSNYISKSNLELADASKTYDKLSSKDHPGLDLSRSRPVPVLFDHGEVELIDNAWVRLGYVDAAQVKFENFQISGRLSLKADSTAAAVNVKVILSTSEGKVVKVVNSNAEGYFQFDGLMEKTVYDILVEDASAVTKNVSRYLLKNVTLCSQGNNESINVPMVTTAPADTMVLLTIHFAFDAYKVSEDEQQKIIKWLSNIQLANGPMEILIEGHADRAGNSAYNLHLSEQRVKSVLQILTSHGFPATAIKCLWYGETRPVEATERPSYKNRRVEFKRVE